MARIHFLNVGHGDCTIIEHNDSKLTVIDINNGDEIDERSAFSILETQVNDPGRRAVNAALMQLGLSSRRQMLREAGYEVELTNPVEFLEANYPNRPIFRYIQTHPDFDHMRGLAALEASGIQIFNFWDTHHSRQWDEAKDQERDMEDWDAYQRYRSGSGSTVLRLYPGATGKYWNQNEDGTSGGNGLEILSPTRQLAMEYDVAGKRNNLSYVLRYKTANRTIIFGGDAEQAAWDSIQANYKGELKCDVLKASHHGRDSGFHQEAVKAMSPQVTVVSVGKKPESDASNKYRSYSQRVWSTRWWGNLTLTIDGSGNMSWTASETKYASR